MANHGAAALVMIASLVAVAVADARLTAHNGFVAVADVQFPVALTCNKVHGVQKAETCFTVSQSAGLTQDQFLAFNPNINCEKVFVGQWVCLDATAA
uniref:LysM domain-containing protein n=1 Tax=Leersia perrieri TaxID=77586 RepID=A0A0D9V6I3_9ORYZ